MPPSGRGGRARWCSEQVTRRCEAQNHPRDSRECQRRPTQDTRRWNDSVDARVGTVFNCGFSSIARKRPANDPIPGTPLRFHIEIQDRGIYRTT